jgi:uncharacterized membrane protein
MTVPRMSRVTGAYPRRTFARRLRRYFLVGLIIIAPVGVTLAILSWLFQRIDGLLGVPLQRAIGVRIPGLGFVLLLVFVVVVGWVVHLAAGRQMLHWWNHSLARFPLTGRIYNAVSQIVQSVVGRRKRLFLRTVLIPYPTEGLWAIAFVTNEDTPEMSRVLGEPCVNVFVPTTPNPTSGFMLVVPHARARDAQISVEEAMKLVISAGAVNPSDRYSPLIRRGLDLESLLRETGEWKGSRG